MNQIMAYEAFGIFADYDGNAPDTHTLCLVDSEDLAKQVCARLNEKSACYTPPYVEGYEWCKRFVYQRELTDKPEHVLTTLEGALEQFECDDSDDDDDDSDDGES